MYGKMSRKPTAATSSLTAVHSDSHKQSILSKLDKLRKRDLLCDVTLVVEDVHFRAHKALLAASSDYFSLMFTSGDRVSQSTFKLGGVDAKMFSAVLEFVYSARVSLEESAAQRLLATARLTQVNDLVKVLTEEVTCAAAGVRGDEGKAGEAQVPDLSKRKRGRPRKNVAEPVTAPKGKSASCEAPEEEEEEEEDQAGDADCKRSGGDSLPRGDADYNPGGQQSRQSNRKIRPPVKYKSYKVDKDAAASKEPGKRGRKRKYPNTEARCEDCGKVFKNHLFLKNHQRTHTGEKPFRCQVCGKSFTQKHTLLVHQRIHTGEKLFVCNVCSKTLCTKHSLQEHMNLHKEEKSFNCDKCGKTFTQKKQLRSHYRVHTGKSLPECAQCHHKFLDTAQLKKHLRTHTGEKPFTCEICGKCFTVKSTLQTHIRIHRGEKPYGCDICNKSFSDPSARRRHVASHSGKKSFTCSSCNLSFTRLDNLKTHTKSHSKERAASPSEAAEPAAAPQEDVRSILQYQLPSGSEQEIQLVVTGDVNNINFVPSQDQEISIITTGGEAAAAALNSRLTLLTQPSGHVQNVALVAQGTVVDHGPQIQTVSMLEGPMTITLSKEAMEQLQSHHCPPQPLHIAPPRPVQQLQVLHQPIQPLAVAHACRGPHSQAIHISSQSSQPISISQTSEQISSHHIQGQTFQIQAGTVSYLYTTGLQEG